MATGSARSGESVVRNRSIQLNAIREVLAGSPPEQVDRKRRRRLRRALDAVALAADALAAGRP